mmetsp:Transcript_12780/g.14201  ORF Transcript_12780/g.14201 Transcript_12780/m.14201 type:complete len:220 (+) Transcript_12780:27-686(+)
MTFRAGVVIFAIFSVVILTDGVQLVVRNNSASTFTFEIFRFVTYRGATPAANKPAGYSQKLPVGFLWRFKPYNTQDYLYVSLGDSVSSHLPLQPGRTYQVSIIQSSFNLEITDDPPRPNDNNSVIVNFPPFLPSQFPFSVGLAWKKEDNFNYAVWSKATPYPNLSVRLETTNKYLVKTPGTTLPGCQYDLTNPDTVGFTQYLPDGTWNCTTEATNVAIH